MGAGAMGKDSMGKDSMGKDAMGKGMAAHSMALSSIKTALRNFCMPKPEGEAEANCLDKVFTHQSRETRP